MTSLRRFGHDRSGVTAIEFSLVALPLIVVLLMILQVGLVFAAQYALDSATNKGARLLRTGQAQNQAFDAAEFKTEVCKHLTALLSCDKLELDIRRFANFTGSDLTNPLDDDGELKTAFSYDPGVGGEVVVVRSFYSFDLPAVFPTPLAMGTMSDGSLLLVATAAFRNEPFQIE